MTDRWAGTSPATTGGHRMEARIGRVLGVGTLIAVVLLAMGSLLLLGAGRSPLDPAPSLDPTRLLGDLTAVRPAAFLWLGLVVVVVTPASRVVAALVGYLGAGERGMALVGALVLLVIAAGVLAGTVGS